MRHFLKNTQLLSIILHHFRTEQRNALAVSYHFVIEWVDFLQQWFHLVIDFQELQQLHELIFIDHSILVLVHFSKQVQEIRQEVVMAFQLKVQYDFLKLLVFNLLLTFSFHLHQSYLFFSRKFVYIDVLSKTLVMLLQLFKNSLSVFLIVHISHNIRCLFLVQVVLPLLLNHLVDVTIVFVWIFASQIHLQQFLYSILHLLLYKPEFFITLIP